MHAEFKAGLFIGLLTGSLLSAIILQCGPFAHAQQFYPHPYEEPTELTPNEQFERDTQQRALKGFLFDQMQRKQEPC